MKKREWKKRCVIITDSITEKMNSSLIFVGESILVFKLQPVNRPPLFPFSISSSSSIFPVKKKKQTTTPSILSQIKLTSS